MCCLIFSRRGLSYFGVAIHLLVALLMLPIVTFTGILSIETRSNNIKSKEVFALVGYNVSILLLGFTIYWAILKECFRTTLACTIMFIILQVTAIGGTLFSWSKNHEDMNYDPDYLLKINVLKVILVFFNCFASFVYVAILVVFMGHMKAVANGGENITKNENDYQPVGQDVVKTESI